MTIVWAKAVKELSSSFPLPVLLKKAKLPKATFYWAIAHMDEDPDADIKAKILEVFKENKGRYGVRRVCVALNDEEGDYKIKISHGRVQRLMHEMGLMCLRKKENTSPTRVKSGRLHLTLWTVSSMSTTQTRSGEPTFPNSLSQAGERHISLLSSTSMMALL